MKASTILNRTKVKQCTGHYSCDNGGFCAYGVLLRHFGWKGAYTKSGKPRANANAPNEIFQKVADLLHISSYNDGIKWAIIRHNDNDKWSFKQIADWLRMEGL